MQSRKKDERERVIDENLKRVFDETLDEGIPDRFKLLLDQLKQQDAKQGSDK
ncbi:NepR family anti-sigma factor [Sulfitobacter sp. SK011]|uniref:NepR family anti-sigma factor n=1 Tax=Sulfitobacter sp. SK011 TaxID=1389004 RepID=UPI000E0A91CB|nr:NepR family anti-sigma factor [Sulfitobacter sp. SK011]AXI40547.1 regulator [Sulfitobacter sp. SK011]